MVFLASKSGVWFRDPRTFYRIARSSRKLAPTPHIALRPSRLSRVGTDYQTEKISRLHADLGKDTAFVRSLVTMYRGHWVELSETGTHTPNNELATLAHRLAGSTSMIGPDTLLPSLHALEAAARADEAVDIHLHDITIELTAAVESLEEWVEQQ